MTSRLGDVDGHGSVSIFERFVAALEQSSIRPIVDRVFAFDDARATYKHLVSGQHLGKVVVRVDGGS